MTERDATSGTADLRVWRTSVERLDPCRADVTVLDSHISSLVFDGDVVHKRKRAVRYPFIDLSTAALREATCRKEIEVNRRFSPDVYLGLEELVDGEGTVVDHAVLMRRMPADRRLSTLVHDGADVSRCLREIARIVASAHSRAVPRGPDIDRVASPDALLDLWRRSLLEMEHFAPRIFDPSLLAEIGGLAERYLSGRAPLLDGRIARGLIVDGHGDLLADDIFCLDDGPRILDALEFDDRLRWGDVIADVAFLAMDLERLGRPDLAGRLFDWYREFTDEVHPVSLADHYVAYRALVRAKVACLGAGDETTQARVAWTYLAQTRRHLLDGRVQLVVIGGLPGTGKSTLARGMSTELGWPVLSSDETRKELEGLDPLHPAPADYCQGLYSPARTEATYHAMLDRARRLLENGESVVLDASFAARVWREAAAVVAAVTDSDLTEIRCHVPPVVAELRLACRGAHHPDPSDATAAVARRMTADFDEWPTAWTTSTLSPRAGLASELAERIRGTTDNTESACAAG